MMSSSASGHSDVLKLVKDDIDESHGQRSLLTSDKGWAIRKAKK